MITNTSLDYVCFQLIAWKLLYVSKPALVSKLFMNMDDVYKFVKPYLVFSKVIGLYPVTFDGPLKDRKSLFKWHDWILPVVNITTVLYLICGTSSAGISFMKPSSIQDKAWSLMATFDISSYFLLLVYQLYKRHNLITFLSKIYDYDEQVFRDIYFH